MLKIPEFNLYLIRHGESETNAQPDKMGQTCWDPLTELGKQQAQKLRNYFKNKNQEWDYVFSSTYNRAENTARIVVENSYVDLHLALREYDPGSWLGVSRKETVTQDVKLKMGNFNHNFQPPNGESLNQVQRRVTAWLDENILYNNYIFERFEELKRPLEIAVFSHGLTIKCLLQSIMGFDKTFTWKIIIDNTSVSKLSFGKEGWRIHSINDCSHLV